VVSSRAEPERLVRVDDDGTYQGSFVFSMITQRDSASSDLETGYLSKKVLVNGQTVTLYSQNGLTWVSSPEQLPEIMERLDGTRILLHDPQEEAASGSDETKAAVKQQPVSVKPTVPKYRMRGPKPRPILDQGEGAISGPAVEPVPASLLEVKLPAHALRPDVAAAKAASMPQKIVAPVSQKSGGAAARGNLRKGSKKQGAAGASPEGNQGRVSDHGAGKVKAPEKRGGIQRAARSKGAVQPSKAPQRSATKSVIPARAGKAKSTR
jgi:hypothetical protein